MTGVLCNKKVIIFQNGAVGEVGLNLIGFCDGALALIFPSYWVPGRHFSPDSRGCN